MTKEVAEKIVKGIEDKIECNTVDIDDWAEFWGFTREEYEEFLDIAIKASEQQPCEDAQPQPKPKSGKWKKEWLTDSMTGRDGIYRVCSECGYEEDYYSGRKLDYCPRCGSRNKEGVDE